MMLTVVAFTVVIITDIEGWAISPRGAGFLFGGDIVYEVCFFFVAV